MCISDTQCFGNNFGKEEYSDREDDGEQPQAAGIEDILVTRAGNGGANRVCRCIENQDRRYRHIHVFLEPRQQSPGTFLALQEDFDLRPG